MGESLRRDFVSSMDELERAADIKGWAEAEIDSATTNEPDDGDRPAIASGSEDEVGSRQGDESVGEDDDEPVRLDPFDPKTKRVSAFEPFDKPKPEKPADREDSAAPEDGAA